MINIGIPTRGRPEKLANCVKSIDSDKVKVHIYCYDTYTDVPDMLWFDSIVVNTNNLTIASHNLCTQKQGSFLGLSDDIEFHKGAIDKAYDCLIDNFPDTDGVVYFNVVNMDSVAGAYMLLGDKFIDRFPNRMPYYPEYRFMRASSELRIVANKWKKVVKCKEAKINHFHPAAGYEADETHNRIRSTSILTDDTKLFNRRQSENKLWGYNQFEVDVQERLH